MEATARQPKTQAELIAIYEKQLKKVKIFWCTDTDSTIRNEKAQEYIDFAESELQAVKNGRNY